MIVILPALPYVLARCCRGNSNRENSFPEQFSFLPQHRSIHVKMNLNRFKSFPILSVFIVMGFVYYTTIYVFLQDWLGIHTSSGTLNALIFSILAIFSLYSFFVCVVTDPGSVPLNYVPDVEENQGFTQDSKNLKRCDKCSGYKPSRTHHCRVCKRCILKMDHHCIWINSCVGYRNYKAFCVLLLYGASASMHAVVIFTGSALQKNWRDLAGYDRGLYVACGVLLIGLFMTLITLLGWHIYLLSHNMTTIEYYEGLRAAWLARKSGQIYRHTFDVGAYRNVSTVLGPNMLKWLCPAAIGHLKDGTGFPTSKDPS